MAGIDLHIHSTASDGTLTPQEILAAAKDLELRAIAITDHDTVDGAVTALEAGVPDGLEFVTGVEISADIPSSFPSGGSLSRPWVFLSTFKSLNWKEP